MPAAAINSFFVENHSTGPVGSLRTYRIARGVAPYRPISYWSLGDDAGNWCPLLFDGQFIASVTEIGKRDARRWSRRRPQFWWRDAEHDLWVGQLDRERLKEQHAIEEFLAHRMLSAGS